MSNNEIPLHLVGAVIGEYYISSKDQDEQIGRFIEKCAKAGVKKYTPCLVIGALRRHPWVLTHMPCGTNEVEYRGLMQYNEYGANSPVKTLVKRAHEFDIEVHPYIHVPTAGVWAPYANSPAGEYNPVGWVTKFAADNPEYWTKTQDGVGFLDIPISEHRSRDGVGFLGLSYPEVRNNYVGMLSEVAETWDVDGVTVEFVPKNCINHLGEWAFGYDKPAIEEYKKRYGADPAEVGNSDENWIKLRGEYFTQYMRDLKKEMTRHFPDLKINTFETGGAADPSTAHLLMLDWPKWVEEGLIDSFSPFVPLVNPQEKVNLGIKIPWADEPDQITEVIGDVKKTMDKKCTLNPLISLYSGVPDFKDDHSATVSKAVETVINSGADSIGFYRADIIAGLNLWKMLENISKGNL